MNKSDVNGIEKDTFLNFLSLKFQKELIRRAQRSTYTYEEIFTLYTKLFLLELECAMTNSEWYASHKNIVDSYCFVDGKAEKGMLNSEMSRFFYNILRCYYLWVNADMKTSLAFFFDFFHEEVLLPCAKTGKYVVEISDSDNKPLYRGRYSKDFIEKRDIFHISFRETYKIKNQRFSITGQPLLYLTDKLEGITHELEVDNMKCIYSNLYVSQYTLKKDIPSLYFFDLRIQSEKNTTDSLHEVIDNNDFRLFMNRFILSCICSFPAIHKGSDFIEEYVIPQMITQSVKNYHAPNGTSVIDKYSGICYESADYNLETTYTNFAIFTNKSQLSAVYDDSLRNKFNITNPITADVIEGKNKIDASSFECVGIIKDFYETVNMKNLHIKERLSTESGKEFEQKYTDYFSDVTSRQKENHYNINVRSDEK